MAYSSLSGVYRLLRRSWAVIFSGLMLLELASGLGIVLSPSPVIDLRLTGAQSSWFRYRMLSKSLANEPVADS